MEPAIKQLYGNKIRIRVCGLCWQGDLLLMVNHRGLSPTAFWAPPGGGVTFGESAADCLSREFLEETGLAIKAEKLQFACEFIRDPLHAVELFFEVSVSGGQLAKGDDPELPILDEVRFMSLQEISALPQSARHGIFNQTRSAADLRKLSGFFTI